MEQLRALGAQLLAIWSQLGVNQKLTVAASGFIVAVTLAVVVFFTSRTDFVLLYGGLDPGCRRRGGRVGRAERAV